MEDDTKIEPPAEPPRAASLHIPLTVAERELLDRAAGEHTATWARLVLLAAAKGM
jgi:hypothetical protein